MKEKNQIKNRINKKYTFTYTKQETFFALESNQRKKTEKKKMKWKKLVFIVSHGSPSLEAIEAEGKEAKVDIFGFSEFFF